MLLALAVAKANVYNREDDMLKRCKCGTVPQNAVPQQPKFFVGLQPRQQQISICEHAFALSLNVPKLGFADSEALQSLRPACLKPIYLMIMMPVCHAAFELRAPRRCHHVVDIVIWLMMIALTFGAAMCSPLGSENKVTGRLHAFDSTP